MVMEKPCTASNPGCQGRDYIGNSPGTRGKGLDQTTGRRSIVTAPIGEGAAASKP